MSVPLLPARFVVSLICRGMLPVHSADPGVRAAGRGDGKTVARRGVLELMTSVVLTDTCLKFLTVNQ